MASSLATSHDDTLADTTPDSSFAESIEDASQNPPLSSQEELQLADSSFNSLQDPDDETSRGRHPKATRKRTKPEDKRILEDAYARNPKPTKEERKALVNLVSLSEKAIQIWFQNRRQNHRRKDRPLSPGDLARLGAGRHLMLDHHQVQDMPEERHIASDPAPTTSAMLSSPQDTRPSTSVHGPADTANPSPPLRGHVRSFSDAPDRAWPAVDGAKKRDSLPEGQSISFGSDSASHSFTERVGWFANRRNLASSMSASFSQTPTRDESSRSGPFQFSPASSQGSQAPMETPSTSFTLRHSLDGQAQLVSTNTSPEVVHPSSSPELPRPASRTFRRSLTAVTLPSFSTLTEGLPSPMTTSQVPRLARGSSRDVKTWESCAKAEPRDELIALAEHDSNGSAIAAISILRNSSNNALQPSGSSKRNASMSTDHSRGQKKFKLSRTTSLTAHMETIGASSLHTPNDELKKARLEKIAVTSLLGSPTDSDKENLTPDEDGEVTQQTGRHRSRRPLPSAAGGPRSPRRRPGGLLTSSTGRPRLLQERALTAPTRPRAADSHVSIFEDSPGRSEGTSEAEKADSAEASDDVQRFMQGQVSPSKKEEYREYLCVNTLVAMKTGGSWR